MKDIEEALKKKALGYTVDEVVEEYGVGEDGNQQLTKKKVTTKHYPPDLSAIKTIMEMTDGNEYQGMSEEELLKQKRLLLNQLKGGSENGSDQDQREKGQV